MYNFLVLGLVPGTNIRITFRMWLNIIGLSLVVLGVLWLVTNRRRFNLVTGLQIRQPLHASQLHRRA